MRKQLAIIMVLLITVFIGFGIIIPIMPEMVSTFHLAVMLAVYSAASFLMSPIWGALSDRIGRRPVIMVGILGFSISFFIFGIAGDQLWLMYASRILGGFFSGAVTACAVAYVADITSEDNRTKGMGLVGMSIGLGFIFGPAVGGLLSVYGNSVPFKNLGRVLLRSGNGLCRRLCSGYYLGGQSN
jgi:DHA1 family multidrug resistance protein-like MFS transporter